MRLDAGCFLMLDTGFWQYPRQRWEEMASWKKQGDCGGHWQLSVCIALDTIEWSNRIY
jgi:hypothetical protein